ncbi:UAA transporter [Halteromyces radiatus]|uniref:UAA transporter n=1 Tax=Halteromyces radiatus TaxID=101107 RepID=UPI00221F0678|nr:UAA transporter [Halteromyces radiatus]KAI8100021.1 UAA transporter [Halteromyces radiatus]
MTSSSTFIGVLAQIIAPELPIILSLIFGGCCSNVFALEVLVTDAPKSGNLVTFAQFLFVALEGIRHQLEWGTYGPRFKKTVVPIYNWVLLVILFFTVSVLNNLALGYHISVPLHIIFRSGGLIVNMIMGAIILGKRYSFGQIIGVLCVTFGVILATLDNSNTSTQAGSSSTTEFVTGISLLVIAMILSAGMGLFQEVTYKKYGKQWREGLFYTHFLALPCFLLFFKDIQSQIETYNMSTMAPLMTVFDEVPLLGSIFHMIPPIIADYLNLFIVPKLWAYLFLNMITQYICIAGVNRMTAVCTSLTLNLVLNLRKFTSLVISIIYFENAFGLVAQIGSAFVIFGTLIYTRAGLKKPVTSNDKKSS